MRDESDYGVGPVQDVSRAAVPSLHGHRPWFHAELAKLRSEVALLERLYVALGGVNFHGPPDAVRRVQDAYDDVTDHFYGWMQDQDRLPGVD